MTHKIMHNLNEELSLTEFIEDLSIFFFGNFYIRKFCGPCMNQIINLAPCSYDDKNSMLFKIKELKSKNGISFYKLTNSNKCF